jgi:hypothetical protein
VSLSWDKFSRVNQRSTTFFPFSKNLPCATHSRHSPWAVGAYLCVSKAERGMQPAGPIRWPRAQKRLFGERRARFIVKWVRPNPLALAIYQGLYLVRYQAAREIINYNHDCNKHKRQNCRQSDHKYWSQTTSTQHEKCERMHSIHLYYIYVCGQPIAQLNLFGCDRCRRSDKTAPQSAQDTSVKTNERKLLYERLKHLVTFDFSCVHHFINNSIAVWRLGV